MWQLWLDMESKYFNRYCGWAPKCTVFSLKVKLNYTGSIPKGIMTVRAQQHHGNQGIFHLVRPHIIVFCSSSSSKCFNQLVFTLLMILNHWNSLSWLNALGCHAVKLRTGIPVFLAESMQLRNSMLISYIRCITLFRYPGRSLRLCFDNIWNVDVLWNQLNEQFKLYKGIICNSIISFYN